MPFGSVQVPSGAEDASTCSGHTVMPGIIGLHDHMYLSSNMGGMSDVPRQESVPTALC